MNEDTIIAYSIINQVCKSKGLPMHRLLTTNLFGRKDIATATSQIKAVSVHNIKAQTKLTHTEIGHLFKLADHTASIYFGKLYHDLYKTDKHFRFFADHALN